MSTTSQDLKESDLESVSLKLSSKVIFILGLISGQFFLQSNTSKWMIDPVLNYLRGYEFDFERNCVLVKGRKRSGDYCRPLANCKAICTGMTAVHEFEEMEPATFLEHYAYSGQPLIVRNAARNWTAMKTFSFEYFRDLYINLKSPILYGDNCQFFAWGSEFRNLYHALLMPEVRYNLVGNYTPWYFGWENCDKDAMPELRMHYDKPDFLPEFSRYGKKDWFFIGSPGYGAPLHIDNVGLPSWQAQILGTKKWRLQPPPECLKECQNEYTAIQRPGDILFINTNVWYHGTEVLGKEVSITVTNEYD